VHITDKEGNLPFQVYSLLLSRDYIRDTMIGSTAAPCGYQAEPYRRTHAYHKNHWDNLFLSITNSYI